MKALAILAACLGLSLPAQAFVHTGGGHGGARPHPGAARFRHGGGFDLFDLGWAGAPDGYGGPGPSDGPAGFPPEGPPTFLHASAWVAPLPPPVWGAMPPAVRPSGPRIIYLGHVPRIEGPEVIYGVAP